MKTSLQSSFHATTAACTTAALLLSALPALAGSYAPAAGEDGSTAVYYTSEDFTEWASEVIDYSPGTNVSDSWQDTSLALGIAVGTSYDITCLGRGGTMTLGFDYPITNGDGWDFAVFENSFSNTFLELAYVEVSSDGENFVRFPNHSETESAVGAYGSVDPTCIDGLAGKYKQGYGTPFDLSDLEDVDGVENVDLTAITAVRIVDIVGDGTYYDSDGNVIYDPYPTTGSAGFDLDAIGVRYYSDGGSDVVEVGDTVDAWATTWYGVVYAYASGDGWIYSWDNQAWQYFTGDSSGAWIYDYDLDWTWSESDYYPCTYLYDLDKWVWFLGTDDDGTREYYILEESVDTSLQSEISNYPYITDSEILSLQAD